MKVLLAVDDAACSARAVDAVIAAFGCPSTQVLVLHAVEWFKDLPPYVSFARGSGAVATALGWRAARFEHAHALVERVASRLRGAGCATTALVREGDPKRVILEEAARWQADLIVVGTHGRQGWDRVALGSVAQGVLHGAPCSVETARASDRSTGPGDRCPPAHRSDASQPATSPATSSPAP